VASFRIPWRLSLVVVACCTLLGAPIAVEAGATVPAATPVIEGADATADPTAVPGALAIAAPFSEITAGASHTCAMTSTGEISCWGSNDDGESTPPPGTYKAVSAGNAFTCAIRSDDTLACWGYEEFGETTPPSGTFTAVSAGNGHACALRSDATVACWGLDDHGQATPPAGTFTAVSAGGWHSCGIKSDGTVACWGWNSDGQSSPPGGTFTAVSAGIWHTCAIRPTESVVCWGYDDGDGRTSPAWGTYSEVGAAVYHSCGLRTDGSIACWGYDGDHQASPPAGTFDALGVGYWHNCALKTDGTPVCWGWNYYNQAVTEWPEATTYVPVTPTRLLDSRTGNGLSGKFTSNDAREFQVTGRGPVPADAVAVTGNFTVTRQTAAGYGALTPEGTDTPTTSTINFPVGISAANNVTVALGPAGKLGAVYKAKSGATTDFVFDVTGYFVAGETGATYDPVAPVRLLDTRYANGLSGRFTSRVPRTWQIAGRGGIPSGATAVTGNLTIVGETGSGYVALGPVATSTPTTSTLNVPVGDTRANGFTVKLGAGGTLSAVYMAGGGKTTHLVLDVTGYYTADLSGARFHPLTPDRVLDSRYDVGLEGTFKTSVARTLTVAARVGVPDDAIAVTGNLTVVGQTKPGYAAMTQTTTNNPTTSTLNFPIGQTRANGVTGPLSPSGTVGLVYKAGTGATTNLVLDITGYFQAPDITGAGVAPATAPSGVGREPPGRRADGHWIREPGT
jgi:Regulator of chromosome condensation (RCC1) repeat